MTVSRRTEDLILDLAAQPAPPRLSARATVGAMLAMLVLCVGVFSAASGLRPDLAEALGRVPVLAKSVLPLAVAVWAVALATASARPGAKLVLWPLAVPLALGLVLVAQRVTDGTGGDMLAETVGLTALACLVSITALSLPPVAAGLVLLRRGAPTRPVLTGALTGLAAGAGVAAGYALHCVEDSPLFFVTWYTTGTVLAAALGAYLGHRMLRW